jgi:hypothetical protein
MLPELAAPVMPSESAVRKESRLLRPACVVLDRIERAGSLKSTDDTDGLAVRALLRDSPASMAVWYAEVEGNE